MRTGRKIFHRRCGSIWRDAGAVKADVIRNSFIRVMTSLGRSDSTCPKSWRHTFATLLQDGNVDPLIRQLVLGHKRTAGAGLGMTANYTHTRPEAMRSQVKQALRLWPRSLRLALERLQGGDSIQGRGDHQADHTEECRPADGGPALGFSLSIRTRRRLGLAAASDSPPRRQSLEEQVVRGTCRFVREGGGITDDNDDASSCERSTLPRTRRSRRGEDRPGRRPDSKCDRCRVGKSRDAAADFPPCRTGWHLSATGWISRRIVDSVLPTLPGLPRLCYNRHRHLRNGEAQHLLSFGFSASDRAIEWT